MGIVAPPGDWSNSGYTFNNNVGRTNYQKPQQQPESPYMPPSNYTSSYNPTNNSTIINNLPPPPSPPPARQIGPGAQVEWGCWNIQNGRFLR